MTARNLGQVAGIHVGTTPPQNVKLIWWDSTPSQQVHKVYDYNLKQWVILNQGILSTITYSELKNIANSVGLSVGKFYVITDRGNTLALSITRTKIQYVDTAGNLLVDDLASNIQYYISSNNLTFDGESGTFNSTTTKLDFEFTDVSSLGFQTAYLYAKDVVSSGSSLMRLVKFKLSSLISSASNNALTWNNGLYFNFNQTLLDLADKKGGVVLFDTYEKEQGLQDVAIQNIANNYSSLVDQVTELVKDEIAKIAVMETKVPALDLSGGLVDPVENDSLFTVLSKIQKYINSFKLATGIKLSPTFVPATEESAVAPGDTVEVAFGKVQKFINDVGTGSIPDLAKKVQYDYVVTDVDSLMALNGNTTARNVLIKKGVYNVPLKNYNVGGSFGFIELRDNIETITGEGGAIIIIDTLDKPLTGASNYAFMVSTGNGVDRIDKKRIQISGIKFYLDISSIKNISGTSTFNITILNRIKGITNCDFYFGGVPNTATIPNLTRVRFTALLLCSEISNCNFEGIDVNTLDTQGLDLLTSPSRIIYFDQCYNISNIVVKGAVVWEVFDACERINNAYVSMQSRFGPYVSGTSSPRVSIKSCVGINNLKYAETYLANPASDTEFYNNGIMDRCTNVNNTHLIIGCNQYRVFSTTNGIIANGRSMTNVIVEVSHTTIINGDENRQDRLFWNCDRLMGCRAVKEPETGKGSPYGFYNCRQVICCSTSYWTNSQNSFYNSYSTYTDSSSNACADTTQGGCNATLPGSDY